GRGRPRSLALPLAAALALLVAGTAAAGTYLALRSSSIAPFAEKDVEPAQRVEPGTSRVVELRAPDPDRSAPPWALRLSRSGAGLLCTTVGQVRGDEFGLVGLDGVFRGLPEANADACGDEGEMIGTRVFAARRTSAVRTVVNGVAGEGLERVTVASRGGRPREVARTAEGAFLAVLTGYPEDNQPVVTLHRGDGRTRRYAFADGAFVVPDPYGGRAWKLESYGYGGPRKRAGQKQPRYQPGCVQFRTARAVPGERTVSSPPVCGLNPARPDVPQGTLFFHTRRLSGDRPLGDAMLHGDWNDHPPRTVVYGSAREHRRIVVTGPGVRRVARPLLNGAFLVILPPATRPSTVAVEVDGRRHGPSAGTIDPRRAR
ncbi:MAG TPA: hypothetical protein VGW10_14385, partial [Solirubrobacteraceae bacterium]|nr:hypothetical protein [Solirubrobacteraceae bacterium]